MRPAESLRRGAKIIKHTTSTHKIDTMHPRIEKSAHRRGEYVGYCNGAQRIRKGGEGWRTYALGSTDGTFIPATAPTLRQLGDKLDKLEPREP